MAQVPAWQIWTTVITAAASAGASYQSSRVAAAAAERNADVQEAAAGQAKLAGQDAAADHKMKVAKLIGRQRSAMSGSGLLVDTGTNLEVVEETAHFGGKDSVNIENDAYSKSWGYEEQAASLMLDAGTIRARGAGAVVGTMAGAGSELAYLNTQYD